jgi:hypothetical protein
MPPDQARVLEQLMPYLAGGGTLWSILASPITTLVGIYVGAGVLHLVLMLFRGAARGFDASLTTVGYAYGLWLLLAVPACGNLIALVWYVVVLIVGLAEAQRCGTGKAAAAVFLPGVLLCCCCGGLGMMGVFGLVKALGGATQGGPVDL